MEERRKNTRTELQAEIVLKRLDQKEEYKVGISIFDVSRKGVGFVCSEQLKVGAVYECDLTIWTKEVIKAFIEIVRSSEKNGEYYEYGSIFVGMNELDAGRIETYQTIKEFKG